MLDSEQKFKKCLTVLDVSLDTDKIGSITKVTRLCLDSRKVNESSIFVGLASKNHKSDKFVEQAVKNKAPFIIIETDIEDEHGDLVSNNATTVLKVFCLSARLYDFACVFYFEDNQKLPKITAVTGTNGKTSVASIAAQLASLTAEKPLVIGTLGITEYCEGRPNTIETTINTTPDLLTIIHNIYKATLRGCTMVFIEASSHGLEQKRFGELPINCGIFTNLTQDHLDYHQYMSHYAAAKRKLLQQPQINHLVLNADDPESLNWFENAPINTEIRWYSINPITDNKQGFWASNISFETDGLLFDLHYNFKTPSAPASPIKIKAPLLGQFNVSNILASITALSMQGFDINQLIENVCNLTSVNGRMELYPSVRATMLVDYAHTPDALEQALKASKVHTTRNLICVFGCGGNRDQAKRAIMGKVADTYCDRIVLTNDNPRSEDPYSIVGDIQRGISRLSELGCVEIELDREQAIKKALQNTTSEDLVLIAGKGHETFIEINGKQIFYNERALVKQLSVLNSKDINNATCHDGELDPSSREYL